MAGGGVRLASRGDSHEALQGIVFRAALLQGRFHVVVGLEADPELGMGTQHTSEANSTVDGNATAFFDQFRDAAVRPALKNLVRNLEGGTAQMAALLA